MKKYTILAETHKEEGTTGPGHMHLVISLIKWGFITSVLSSCVSCLLPLSLCPGLAVGCPVTWKDRFSKKNTLLLLLMTLFIPHLRCGSYCAEFGTSSRIPTTLHSRFLKNHCEKEETKAPSWKTCPKSWNWSFETKPANAKYGVSPLTVSSWRKCVSF